MVITYLGTEFFKVQFGDIVVALNPVSKASKQPQSRFGADVALVSMNDNDMNGVEMVTHGDTKPFVISGPGEYEVKGVAVRGLQSESQYGGEKKLNTIYLVSLEGMNLCFLGGLSTKDLKNETVEALEDIDILFMPIGGEGVLSPADAYKFAVNLEPKLIIPMHYGNVGDKDALKKFLKEAGEEGVKAEEKLTLKKKDLEGKEGDIAVLAPQA